MTQEVENIIHFIEQYCLVNGKHIKLKDYQVKFIKWLQSNKAKRLLKNRGRL